MTVVKLLAVITAMACLVLCLSACGNGNGGADDADADGSEGTDTAGDAADVEEEGDAAEMEDADDLDVDEEEEIEPCTDPVVCPDLLALYCEGMDPAETAEEATLSYHIPGDVFFIDASPYGGWQDGDVEATCFDPLHPFVLRTIRVYLAQAGQAEIHLWADYGGSWPDFDADLVEPMTAEAEAEGWVDIELDQAIEIKPYQRVWVGRVHTPSAPLLGCDEGDPFLLDPDTESWAYTNRSKTRYQWVVDYYAGNGDWEWLASPYTYLVELVGDTICRAGDREFADVSDGAFPDPIYATRVSWGDLDGDGYDDFLIHNHRYPDEPKQRLMRNAGDGSFEEWSGEAGLTGRGSNFATFADVDNDGNQDVLLSVYYNIENNPDPAWVDALMINDGTGHFEEKTDANVANGSTTATAAFADYDADGRLDIFAGNTRHHGADEHYDQAMKDTLQRNNGDATFTDVTDDAGMSDQPSTLYPGYPGFYTLTNGAVWTDYDGDGDIDLYVANYGLAGNFMWENRDDGTFLEVAALRNLQGDNRDSRQADGTSFGAHWADFDNDGDMDLFQTEISHPRYHKYGSDASSLRRNPGGAEPVFEIVTEEAGIVWDEGDYEASWVDYDNDGLLDLFISSCYGLHYSRLYRQNPDHTFTDWTYFAGTWMMNAKSHAWADYDRDGDQDLLVCSRQPGLTMLLFRNDVGQDNAWITVRLVGVADARDGIGSKVEVTTEGGLAMVREVRAGGGHTRQDSLPVEFGLGAEETPVILTVTWPTGHVDEYEGVEVRRFVVVTQDADEVASEE